MNEFFSFITLTVLCFFGTIWFGIVAAMWMVRRRTAGRNVERKLEVLAEELERQKRELVDTVLQYDSRITQLESEVERLRRRLASTGQVGEESELRLGRRD